MGTGGLEDLLRLLLGRLHAVLGRPIGLGDALSPALLGPLAEPSGRALRRLENACHTGWCDAHAQLTRVGAPIGTLIHARWVWELLHRVIVNREAGRRPNDAQTDGATTRR